MLRCSIQLYVYKQFMRILLDFLVIANEQCQNMRVDPAHLLTYLGRNQGREDEVFLAFFVWGNTA